MPVRDVTTTTAVKEKDGGTAASHMTHVVNEGMTSVHIFSCADQRALHHLQQTSNAAFCSTQG